MKAMILAAGMGTRLRPLTNTIPKALIPINGMPLLEIVIRRLQQYGVSDILINVHHLAEQIREFLHNNKNFGLTIQISDETGRLLDTGGGLKKAAWFFDEHQPFLLYSVDILSDINLRSLYHFHAQHPQALATLAVTTRASTRCLLFDREWCLCGWKNRKTGEIKLARAVSDFSALAFSSIHVISPSIFALMPDQEVFSIIDFYLHAAAAEQILAYRHDAALWTDAGKPENLPDAARILSQIQQRDAEECQNSLYVPGQNY